MTVSKSTIKFRPHYSGPLSRKFWSRVNSVKGDNTWGVMYTLGCALQDLEGRVLRELADLPVGKNREKGMRKWCDSKKLTLVIEDKNGKNKNHKARH